MEGTLQLRNPIKINNETVNSVAYDTDAITVQMFAEAESRKLASSTVRSGNLSGVPEVDYGLHLYLGLMAVVAVNPDYEITDLEQIRGADVMAVVNIGRNFIIEGSEEPSGPSNSEEPSENTPALSTPLPGSLEENG